MTSPTLSFSRCPILAPRMSGSMVFFLFLLKVLCNENELSHYNYTVKPLLYELLLYEYSILCSHFNYPKFSVAWDFTVSSLSYFVEL